MLTRDRLVGVLLGVLIICFAMIVHHGPRLVDTHRSGVSPVSNDPGIDLVDGSRLAAGLPVPVRTEPYAAGDFRCRSDGSLFPVIPRSYTRGACSVAFQPAVGSRSTVQLVRVDATGAVVEEYRPVTLIWTAQGPDGD